VGPAWASTCAAGWLPSSPCSSPTGAKWRSAEASRRRLSARLRRAPASGAAALPVAPAAAAAAACCTKGCVRWAAASSNCCPRSPAATLASPSTTSCRSSIARLAPLLLPPPPCCCCSAPRAALSRQPKAAGSRSFHEQRRQSCWKAWAAMWLACSGLEGSAAILYWLAEKNCACAHPGSSLKGQAFLIC
jgi:hypothetical protein